MGLFRALVGVAIETVKLPLAIAGDVITLGDVGNPKGTFTGRAIERIKAEADKADEGKGEVSGS